MRALALLLACLTTAGCFDERRMAPLPEDPTVPVVAVTSLCGGKPSLEAWVLFPGKDLVHAEIRWTDENGHPMSASEPLDAAAERAFAATERVGLWSRADAPPHRGVHAETIRVTPEPFTDARIAVADADFEALAPAYGNENVVDGCAWRYAGFIGRDRQEVRTVADYADAAPERLRAVRAALLAIHASY